MSTINALRNRAKALLRQTVGSSTTWSFVLLGADTEIPPDKQALIHPGNSVYIKRIILTHDQH